MIQEKRQCQQCGEALVGRIDKKFCSDYCRNAFNNTVDRESKNMIRNVNNRLRKNYRILTDLNTHGKTKVTRNKLLDAGFNFTLCTSFYRTKAGKTYAYIYDQGYVQIEEERYLLIEKTELS